MSIFCLPIPWKRGGNDWLINPLLFLDNKYLLLHFLLPWDYQRAFILYFT